MYDQHKRVWCGRNDGTSGILAKVIEVKIDGGYSDKGYFGLQNFPLGENRLRLLVNALDYETARNCSRIDWTVDYKCTRT